jgi:DNA repair protein RecO (recombination protein O)
MRRRRYNRTVALASDQCLCLGKTEYSETSQVLTLFSRDHGMVRVLAKGAHRRTKAGAGRFDGGIDLLDLGAGVFTDDPKADLATLTEWKLVNGHLELRRSLRGLRLGQYAAELVSLLIEARDPHPEIFDGLKRTIPELATGRREEALLAWQLDLLKQSGYLPELFACVSCHAKPPEGKQFYFSASRGGLICMKCESRVADRLRIDAPLLRLTQSIITLPRAGSAPQRLPRLTRLQTDPLNRLLIEYITFTLGKRLKTASYIQSRG